MEIGCHLPTQGPLTTPEALVTFARQAEAHRMASLWVSDHVVFPKESGGQYPGGRFPHAPDTPYLEPVQKPHPPIWVGRSSPAALRRAVAMGDGWHGTQQGPKDLRETLDRLRQEADKARRAFDTLELSLRIPLRAEALQGSHQELIDQYCTYKKLGLGHLVVDFRRNDLSQMVETLEFMATRIRPAVQAA